MKKQFFKFLPLMAAVLLATSCSKDDDNNAPENVKPQSGIPFSIRVNTGNSLKKLGYAEDTDPTKAGCYNISFTDEDKNLEMQIYNGKNWLTTLHLTDVAKCEFTGTVENVPDKDAELTAVITTGNGQPITYSDKSLQDLLENCAHTFKTQKPFTYGTEEISLTDQNTYLAISMSPCCEHEIEINKNPYTVRNGRIWIAVPSNNDVKSNGLGNELDKQAKDVEPGKIYTVARQYFTVSASGKKVYLSPGNLQYYVGTAAQAKWRFAPTQYDKCFDNGDHYSSSGYIKEDHADWTGHEGWIDLFGWGTWTVNAKLDPNSTSTTTFEYETGVSGKDDFENVCKEDIIKALGTGWTTLTGGNNANSEWYYLFNSRKDKNDKLLYGKGTVAGVNGVILLPDGWSLLEGLNFTSSDNAENLGWDNNTYDLDAWAEMEANGAVFLPAAGGRYGTAVYGVGSYGRYWSSSAIDRDYAFYLFFYSGNLGPDCSGVRKDGYSVRLVRAL